VIELLQEHGAKNVLLHAFNGKPSNALKGVQQGYYFSVPPSIAHSPQTRNEPKNIYISCKVISRIKGIPMQTVYEETTKNALKLFPKLHRFIRKRFNKQSRLNYQN